MASGSIFRLSTRQLTRLIHEASVDSANVVLTLHAKKRMKERDVSAYVVFECLRKGAIHRTPEPNAILGTLECKMEHFFSGLNCCVVAALSDADPKVVVVTVFEVE